MATRATHRATVLSVRRETARIATFRLGLAAPLGHRAGQHVKVQVPTVAARRSYSIASPPSGRSTVDITVERLEGGLVSGALHDRVRAGDVLELDGPKGSFTWDCRTPALLVGGGTGLVPLMSMLRMARESCQPGMVRMVASVRTSAELIYRDEMVGPEVSVICTRTGGSLQREGGRLRVEDLRAALIPGATAYVCGPKGFVSHVGDLLDRLGCPPGAIRTEAFGPTL